MTGLAKFCGIASSLFFELQFFNLLPLQNTEAISLTHLRVSDVWDPGPDDPGGVDRGGPVRDEGPPSGGNHAEAEVAVDEVGVQGLVVHLEGEKAKHDGKSLWSFFKKSASCIFFLEKISSESFDVF